MTKFSTVLRKAAAADRRQQRERLRRQREEERRRKRLQKAAEQLQAAKEVSQYEAEMENLLSIHKECGERRDWERIRSAQPPAEPGKSHRHEKQAQAQLDQYKPNLQDKLLRRVEKKRAELAEAVEKAKVQDKKDFLRARSEYAREYAQWEANCTLAGKVLGGDGDAYIEAVKKFDPFRELASLGLFIEFQVESETLVVANLYVDNEDVIPAETKTLLKSGKLSVKATPKTKFYAAYQDYICGSVFRVARELFAVLPIQMAIVTAIKDVLNTATGHMEQQPVLSVAIPRETLRGLNFDAVDSSDALVRFVHKMKFYKTKGFAPIERISPSDLDAES